MSSPLKSAFVLPHGGGAEYCHVGEVYITFAKIFSYNFLYILVGEGGNLLFVLISTKSVNMGSS